MLATNPIDLKKVPEKFIDQEVLRLAMMAELDAVNLYEQLAAMAKNKHIKAVLMDVAKEEKTHLGEFQTMLLKLDKEQVEELEHAKEEIEELTGK